MRSYLVKIRWIALLTAAFCSVSVANFGQKSFYVSQKRCANTSNPTGGVGTGVTTGLSTNTDCTEPVMFFDTEEKSVAWQWNFGDPAATASNTSTERNPKHSYVTKGNYTVTLTRTLANGTTQTVSKLVTVGQLPAEIFFYQKKELDTTLCDGSGLKLDPYKHQLGVSPPNVKFIWYPKGQTTQSITVTETGCYSVEVYDPTSGCSRVVRAKVKFCGQESQNSGGTEKWYFGQGGVLDFKVQLPPPTPPDTLAENGDLFKDPDATNPTFVPQPSNSTSPINSPEGLSMFYDSQGKLLLYSDGINVWGENEQLLPALPPLTDNKLGGTSDATQTSIIVPKSTCNECPHHQYYVFTTNKTTKMISYSIVDMRYNNGRGAIVDKDIPFYFPSTERITARMNDTEDGFFIYTHEEGNNIFRILKVDSTGITETTQPIGLAHDDANSVKGYMKLSPFGRQMAVAVSKGGKNYVEIYEIDGIKGTLTLTKTIDLNIASPPYVYGLEFNQDESKLYVTLRGDPASGIKSALYQLNLNLNNPVQISQNKRLIDESTTRAFGALQLGPTDPNQQGQKFIYMAVDGSKEIPYITQPDFVATGTIAQNQAILGYVKIGSLGGAANVSGTSRFGLPTVVRAKPEQDGEGLEATYSGNCAEQPTVFETKGICSPMKGEAYWDFGDGETGKGLTVSHTYRKEGTYKIKLRVEVYSETEASKIAPSLLKGALREFCKEFIVEDDVYIKPSPNINLADSVYVCVIEGEKKELVPIVTKTYTPAYAWKTPAGAQVANTKNFTVDFVGNLVFETKNTFPNSTSCTSTEKIKIKEGCEPRLFVPEAFTPNDDAINNKLDVPTAHITDYLLRIYNRWGEVIFESLDPDIKWDGTYKGQLYAPGVYAYYVTYKSRDFPERPPITKTGGIVIVK